MHQKVMKKGNKNSLLSACSVHCSGFIGENYVFFIDLEDEVSQEVDSETSDCQYGA